MSLNVQIENVILRTDFMISKTSTFAKNFCNRVAAIEEHMEFYQWPPVSFENNSDDVSNDVSSPSDFISGGLDAKDILTCNVW